MAQVQFDKMYLDSVDLYCLLVENVQNLYGNKAVLHIFYK